MKYKNYEVIFIYPNGTRTGKGFDFLSESVRYFENNTTAIKMVVMEATHNNKRIRYYATIER
jgi:hypothetical protein